MNRSLPWWIPRTRVMRTVCIAAAVLIAAAGGWLQKTQVHDFLSFSGWITAGMFTLGLVAGVLLLLALGPIDRR